LPLVGSHPWRHLPALPIESAMKLGEKITIAPPSAAPRDEWTGLERFVVEICEGPEGIRDIGLARHPDDTAEVYVIERRVVCRCEKGTRKSPCSAETPALAQCSTCGRCYRRCASHGGEDGAKRSLHSHRALIHSEVQS